MTSWPPQARSRHAGFTLVEMVVAMALLSLVMLVLGSSIRSMGASAERVETRTARTDEMRVATAFLRDIVGRTAPQRLETPATGLMFSGAPGGMSWVGVMPARFGPAGRHFFRLAVEQGSDGTSGLVLRFAPWRWEQKSLPDWTRAESRVLVRDVSEVSFSYEGAGLAEGWLTAWPAQEQKLPKRLRVLLSAAGSEWPPLILPLHPLPANQGAGGGWSRGPE